MVRPWLALGLSVLAGCSATVDVDDYSFDEDPCGQRPPACERSGTSESWALVEIGPARLDGMGRRAGFNLDGTSDRICGQPDFVGPDGTAGIDNQLGEILELYESLVGVDLREVTRAETLTGDLELLVLEGYDGPDDDCVEVSQRPARLPDGVPLAMLDADGDGRLDPGLTLDYGLPVFRDETACVIGGVLHARFPSSRSTIPGVDAETTVDDGRLVAPLEDERIDGAILGGSMRIAELTGGLPPELVEFLRPRADLVPSSRGARDCANISFALDASFVRAERGAPF